MYQSIYYDKDSNKITIFDDKDILTNIEFKEPRVFYREMLYDSVYPRLLYMHVMKETGLDLKTCYKETTCGGLAEDLEDAMQ